MSRASDWRLALRLARRDALRHRGRSILVLAMIALPVLGVSAADVVIATQDVDRVEGLERRLGAADALITPESGGAVVQRFDPWEGTGTRGDGGEPPGADQVADVLGGARLVEMRTGQISVRSDDGVADIEATEVDLREPVTRGLFDLVSGRWPVDADEVVVNQALLDKGYAVGDRLAPADDGRPAPVIVGVAESATSRTWAGAAGPIGSLGSDAGEWGGRSWLSGGGPVSWTTVRDLNAIGALVLSRAVVTDPPPTSALPEEMRWDDSGDNAMLAVLVLIVVMALLEVVLLAGPAFAVTARRQARTLALLGATGGTPAQARRVIIGGGVVLGSVAAAAGVGLGIGLAWLLLPLLQNWSDSWFGPFEVPWLHLLGIAGFGLASAVLAAVVPAVIASRQDVVAVLAGRRADARPSRRSPVLGVVLLGVGVAGSAYGARASGDGEFAIAASAVVAVLGMILLVPVVVVVVARVAGRLPLSPRYAARDAARHRTRTVPAVAAVAATVAGVVALGIAVTSDEAENRETYRALLPFGLGSVTAWVEEDPVDWSALRTVVERGLPDAEITEVRGLREDAGPGTPSYWLEIGTDADAEADLLSSYGSSLGASTLIGERSLAELPVEIAPGVRAEARRVLGEGGVVAFTDRGVHAEKLHLRLHRWDPDTEEESVARSTVPALVLPAEAGGNSGPQAILSEQAADELGAEAGVVGLLVDGSISRDQQEAVSEALAAVSDTSSFYVERGYEADDETVIIQLVLVGLGAVLMLGGTLTATFLALSDARPDLATLAAVGASPRRRRSVGASYALVIGFVGSVLGAVVGFIPGIAVTYPLTRGYAEVPAHYLDIPWLMILGVVVALPLVTAAVVALSTRSRLPLAARAD